MPYSIPAPFGDSVPFDQMHVWQWAKTVARAEVCPVNYLQSLGFVMGQDQCTESEYQTLEYACETFHRVAAHMPDPVKFSAVMTPTNSGGFYVQGMTGRFLPSGPLCEALIRTGWIYDIEPETTFFAVINGRLFAKYQQIIGSRCLADLISE